MCHKIIVTDNKSSACFFSGQYFTAFYIFLAWAYLRPGLLNQWDGG